MTQFNSPSPVPSVPNNNRQYLVANRVKVATPDLLINPNLEIQTDILAQLLLEDIGGQELINIVRHDLINGQNFQYVPIQNISFISNTYSPINILPIQNSMPSIFNNFSIKFDNFLPARQNLQQSYIDQQTGDIVIDLVNLPRGIQVEVQAFAKGELINATIYEEEL